MLRNFFLAGLTVAILIMPVQAVEKIRIAILDFSAENVQKTYSRAVRNVFEVSLYKAGGFEILERNQIQTILQEQGLQMSGCIDTSCAVKIGKILSADMVVIGSLNRIGEYTVTIKFINVSRGRIELADYETAATDSEIQRAVNIIAERMAEGITGKKVVVQISEIAKRDDGIAQEIFARMARNRVYPPLFFDKYIRISAMYSYTLPSGALEDLVTSGHGAEINITIDDPFFNIRGLTYGFGIGYRYFPGRDDDTDNFKMFPGYLTIGYRVVMYQWIFIEPIISLGASYNILRYDKDGQLWGEEPKYRNEISIDPLAIAGFKLGLMLFENYEVQIGVEHGTIFKEYSTINDRYDFVTIILGVALRL